MGVRTRSKLPIFAYNFFSDGRCKYLTKGFLAENILNQKINFTCTILLQGKPSRETYKIKL